MYNNIDCPLHLCSFVHGCLLLMLCQYMAVLAPSPGPCTPVAGSGALIRPCGTALTVTAGWASTTSSITASAEATWMCCGTRTSALGGWWT